MSIGKVIVGGVIVWGSIPIVGGLLKVFIVLFGFLWISDCSSRMITGVPIFPREDEIAATKKQREEEYKTWSQQYDRKQEASLKTKMNSGDFVAQTELAINHLFNDNPSDDQEAVKWLVAASKKDYAKAQYRLGEVYWSEGDKAKAREQWILAARGREDRSYGTGSYKARGCLWRCFRADYDPIKWDKNPLED